MLLPSMHAPSTRANTSRELTRDDVALGQDCQRALRRGSPTCRNHLPTPLTLAIGRHRAFYMSDAPLKTLLFLGSARKAAPFFGRLPSRTGDRVVSFVKASVEAMPNNKLEIEVIDILNFPSLMSFASLDGNPSYYAAPNPSSLPEDIASLVSKVEAADCYLIVSPEYNHTIPPVLTQMMNMTGCSKYANKVSGTVCYSGFPSPAGGARCAVALRPYLSELGCLPVSKQVIIPNANGQLNEEGVPQGEHAEGCKKQMDGMLEQVRAIQ